MKSNVLLVDDDPFTRKLFENLFRPGGQIDLVCVASVAQARQAFGLGDFHLVILDQRLPDGNGLDLFAEMRQQRPQQTALMVTGHAEVRDAMRAVRDGLFDYLTKPFDNLEALEATVAKALEMDRAYREIADLKQTLAAQAGDPIIISRSVAMERLLVQMRQAAPLDTTVLIEGESGTGKEVIAKSLHALSPRSSGPMKVLNCGALSESLMEAALFGYEKGSFTGAAKTTAGYFEEADNGTIVLDEIADMSPKMQVSLLRVLQEGTFVRLGSTVQRPSSFRLICATNKPLDQEVAAGRFRADLYYRINVVPLHVPPLRERREDIVPLCLFFLDHFNRKFNKQAGPLQADTLALLENAPWAGNVRELKHTMERAVVVNSGGPIASADLGVHSAAGAAAVAAGSAVPNQLLPYRQARLQFEQAYFSSLMQAAGGNVSEASRISGVARQNIYGHLERAQVVSKS
ncbi:sigma-54 dependent transcriptional regulator [Rhodoferax sp. U2-2l]|uniref:sigma-54-dependent transcriptional regulator n=1 Tax=Rhodoferax sp. U2-2l TaxID=2884000 RepID=UPI001D0A8655|nr:sigma-54 dependent transcriptional regulator [Rhodoferax sp. U2-2l]MCB8747459.1 sigma-54 dependent transcriptional regulator [Rhodoferax sp. U2-2l]